ncbi:MAG: PLxRFG domain-containing protein [Vibrio toranzoniae]
MLTIEEFKKKRANRNTSLFGDSVDAFQAGAAESVSGMANFVGWDSAAKKLQEVASSQYETMTPESQSALAKRMINDDLSMGEGMLDGRTWLLQGAKLVGNLATTAVPGGAAGKAVSLAGMAAKGAKGLQAASTAARGTNLGTNISLNVASAGGMLGQQSEQAINELDFADLKDSPAFQNLVLEYGEDKELSSFDVLNKARSTLAKQANETISRDPTMMVINGVFGTFGDQALGKVMTSGLGKTLKAQIGKAMVAEGATEAVQGGAEQYTQNTGINAQAETQLFEPTQGVAANALEGGIIGAVAGGAISAPGHAVHKVKQRSFEKQIEQKLPQQTIDQLRAAGYKDADIKSSLWEKTTNAALAHGFDADQADIMAKNYLSAMFDNGPTAEQRAQAEEVQEAQAPEQPQPQQSEQAQQPQPEQQAPAGRYENTAQGALHNDANNLIKGLQSRRKQALKDNDQELANQIGQDMSRLMGGRDRIVKDITDNEGNITEPKFDEQGRAAYMNALRRTAENYFPEQVQQPEQPPAPEQAPQQEQMFDPETGEVAEPVQQQEPIQQNPETVQQDQNALGESLRRGELGFVDETAQQDARFREGLRRAMDVSPAAVLQVAEMRKSGQMNQNQAISALQRIINSQEVTGIDQRSTDTFEQSLQDESARQRNAQRVQYERGEGGSYQPNVEESPEFQRRQAELLQGRQQQEFTKGQQGQARPNGERDVSPLATGIENQFEANAPQVEFDRWSQVQEGDQGVDQREYNSPYASNPQTTEMEQGTIYQPRQQEREQVRYEEPAPTAQEVVNQSRGQRGGVLKGGLGEQQPKGNQRQQKKAAKKLSAKRQSIYERITQSDPLEANELEFSTGYQPNAAMLEAFDSLSVTQEQPTVQDISERLDQLESDGVIDAEDKQAILEQEQSETAPEQVPNPKEELTPKVDESLTSNNTEQPNSSTVSPELEKSIEHELDVELKRMWDETPATDNLAFSRLTDIRKRFNKVKNGEGTSEDIAWAKEWTDETAKGQTPPEKAEAQKPIAKAKFEEAKTGKSGNPRYQAWLDTLEQADLDEINSNVDYMAWISSNSAEFARINQIASKPFTDAQNKAFDDYLREQADNNLSDRVAEQREPSEKAPTAKKAGGETGPKTSEIANVLRTVDDPLLRDYELFSLYPDDMRKDFADSIQAIIDDLEPIVQNWKEKDPIRGNSDRALYSERNKSVFARLAKTEIDKPLQDYVWLVNKHDTTANKEVFTPLQLLSTGRLDSKMGVGTGKAAHHEALNKLLHNLRQVWDAVRVRESKEETKPTTSLGAEGRVALHKLQDAIKLVKESTRKLDDAKSGGKRTDILEQNLSRQKSNLQRIYDDFISSYGKDFAPNVDGVLNNTDPEPTPPKGTKKGGYTRTNTAPRGSEAAKPKDLKGYTKAILVQEDRPTTKEATLGVAKGLRDDHDAIIAELNSMTMPNIKKMMGTYWAMTHNDYKKGQLVKAAYDGMMKQMLFSISDGAFVTTSGQSGVELGDYVIKQIEAVSNEKFNEIQEKKAEQRKAEDAEAARREEALGDPKTLQDFVAYARNKGNGIESFTPEQLKRYDELVSENKLAQLEQQRKAAAEVKAVNGDVPYQLAETIHTKLQEPRYVVQLTGERMGKDAFKELATRARQLGGNYVNAMQAKRYNTIDGFQFANVDDRNNFSKLLDGESVSREANQQRQLEKKQDSRVTKLKEMADATEARADEVLNQSRKTNTAKRAADAARVMDNAYADQYSARLLRAIAEATESGDIQVLSNLSQKVQLDELDTIERQVLWNMPEAQREKFGQRDDRGNWRLKATTKLDDILFWAKYPVPEARADRLNRLADDMENVSGYKQAAKKIRSNTKKAQDNSLIQMTGRDWESAVAKIRDFARKNKNEYIAENIAEMFKREDRLNRMGIDGPAMLRYVLREQAMIEQRISTDKPAETPVTKLTKKVEETIRANRNAYNDFFPTDNDTLADQVIDEADIQPGMKVLEPSAGMGHLADKIKDTGADLDVGEYAYTMSELLKAKGHNVVSGDFLDYNPGEIYDRIVMNPPFSHDADVNHVTHALTMLKPGGRLVAITSSMAGDRSNSTNKNFREYLDAVGAVERPNPDNSFKDSLNPTGVNTKTIIIDKPDIDENLPDFDDIRFSQNAVVTKPVKGMKAVDVETAAQKWKDNYAGLKAANVQVVQSQAELKDWVQTDPKATVKAVWLSQDNRVILVADNLASPQDVRQAMRHELIGHNGVFGNLDAEQSQLLTDQVMGLRKNKKLASIFAEVDASYKKVPDYVKAEEVVSRLAEQETGKLRQVADRVMAFVMGAMRRSGFLAADKVTLSEVRNMINGVDKYLRKNDGTLSQSDVVRFSQRVDQVQGMDQEYMAALEGSQQSLLQKILKAPKSALGKSNIVDSVKNGGLGLLTLRQLVDVAESKLGSDFHTNMKTYLDEVNQMMADEGNGHQNIMNVFEPLDKWRRKNPELADRTFEAMHEFTLDNVDPFQDYQDLTPELKKAKAVLQEKMKGRSGESKAQWMKEVNEIDAQIKYEPKRKKNLERSKSTLNSLPKEAQKVIKEIRDHYNQQREDMYDAMMERAADLAMNGGLNKGQMLKIRLDNEIAKKSFYVPLTRFGDYFIDGVDENGERVFTMYQTENEMLEAKDRLKASGFEVKSGKSIDSFAGLDTISTTVVKKMFDHLETTTMSQKARDAMKDNVYQMYLESLPNRSIRKQFIHRKGVKGFSKDALQALADQGAKQAKQLAKFKHEDALAKSMANLNDAYNQLKMLPEEEGENRVFTARFMDEMTKRNEWVMNPKRAAWASKLTGFGFLWMIGASPASAMINLTQNIQVAIPVIGSKHGVAATSKVMAGLTGDFFKHFKGAHADMKKRRQFGILGSTILSGDEQNAMKHAIAMGVIDTTQAHDLLDMAENQPTKLTDRKAKIMRGIGWMFHHAEVLNREVTYMTAYRLARQSGDSHQNAMEYATKATWDSHFDYGSLNRARFMQGDVAAVALQFKQYSQNMTYYLFSNFSKAWLNKKIPMDERREARKQLLGTMAATFLFGGLGALPVATIAGIANTAYAVFGDDDDPWDAEVEMREILKEWFGRELAHGIYYGMGTMVGAPNISGRIEIDPLSMWVRPSDAIGARAQFGDYTKQMLGPMYSTIYNAFSGADYIFRDQKYQKGFEMMMPKWVRDVSKTARYLGEGGNIQNNNGDIVVDDLSPLEYVEQVLGFTPNRSVVQYAENRAIKSYERHAMDRRKLLLNGMWLAYRNKDGDSVKKLWKKINEYNKSEWGRARPITQKTVSQSLKSRIRTQANARKGVHFNSKYSDLIDAKFAQN